MTTPAEELRAAPPMKLTAVLVMDGWHAPDNPDHNFAGDLQPAVEQWCHYLVSQLQKVNEPRGGDLFLQVQLTRGDETAGHEYREGRFILPAAPSPSPTGSNLGGAA